MNNKPAQRGNSQAHMAKRIGNLSQSRVLLVDDSEAGDQLVSAAATQSWELVRHDCFNLTLDNLDDTVDCVVIGLCGDAPAAQQFVNSVRAEDLSVPILVWIPEIKSKPLRDILSQSNTSYVPRESNHSLDSALLTQINEKLSEQYVQYLADIQVDAIETAMDGIGIMNLDGKYVYVNEAYVDMFGFSSPEDFMGESWRMCYEPNSTSVSEQEVVDELINSGSWSDEVIGRNANGSQFPVELSLALLNDRGIISVVRDISTKNRYRDELQFERERFGKILDAAPDPIVVVDPENRTIIESNIAAQDIYGTSFQLQGTNLYTLAPEGDRERAHELFTHIYESGSGSHQKYFDDEPIVLETVSGQRLPVSIDAQLAVVDDRDLVHFTIRPIGEQLKHEEALKSLNGVVSELLDHDRVSNVAQTVVESAVTDLGYSACAVLEYDSDSVRFQVLDSRGDIPADIEMDPVVGSSDSDLWDAYRDGEVKLRNGERAHDRPIRGGPSVGSEIIAPLGGQGVLLLCGGSTGTHSVDVELAGLLAGAAESALTRTEKVNDVREKHKQLRNEREHLDYVNDLNEKLRVVHEGLLNADSRSEIHQSVVDALSEFPDFMGAWVCHRDRERGQMVPTERADVPDWYLDELDFSLNNPQPHVSAQVSTSGQPDAISHIASEFTNAPAWRRDAVDHGVRSIAAVPISHETISFGVLVIESGVPSRFDSQTLSILSEIGQLMGFALNALNQQQSLMTEGSTELQFEMLDEPGLLTSVAEVVGSNIFVHNVVPLDDGSHLLHCGVSGSDVSVEEFTEAATSHRRISSVDEIRGDPVLYEVTIRGDSVPTELAQHGLNARELMALPDGSYRFDLIVPPDLPQTRFIEQVKEYFATATLDVDESNPSGYTVPWNTILSDTLTQTEMDTLRTAYVRGYFERGGVKGEVIAESLGISQPGFSQRVRRSLVKLNRVLWGDSPRTTKKS